MDRKALNTLVCNQVFLLCNEWFKKTAPTLLYKFSADSR